MDFRDAASPGDDFLAAKRALLPAGCLFEFRPQEIKLLLAFGGELRRVAVFLSDWLAFCFGPSAVGFLSLAPFRGRQGEMANLVGEIAVSGVSLRCGGDYGLGAFLFGASVVATRA